MSRALLFLEAGFCAWVTWTKVMEQRAAVPAETIFAVIAVCGILHVLISIFYLFRNDAPRAFYLLTGLAVYGLYLYRVFPNDMITACTFGGIGFILIALEELTLAFQS